MSSISPTKRPNRPGVCNGSVHGMVRPPERASRSQKLTATERNVGGDAPTRHARGLFGHHLFVHEAHCLVSPADDGFGEMPRHGDLGQSPGAGRSRARQASGRALPSTARPGSGSGADQHVGRPLCLRAAPILACRGSIQVWSCLPSRHVTVLAVLQIRVPARWTSASFGGKIEGVGDEVVGAEDRRRESYAQHD